MDHKYELKDLSGSKKQLIITSIDPKALEKAEKKVLKELSEQVKVKGFRPGKIPEHVVREQVEETYVKMQSLQTAVPDVANDLVKDLNLKIVGQPSIDFESIDPLKVVIEFELYPEITVGDYSKIKVKIDKKKATEKEVEEAIKHVRERMTEYEKVERAAKKGDRAEIDFDGKTPDGVPLDNASSKNHPIVLGSNMLIPGFEEEIEGMKAGDEKDFEITFPKDYHAKTMAGNKVNFHIKLHQVEEAKLPDLNDEFVEKLTSEKQSVEDWKKKVMEQIQNEHDGQTKQKIEGDFYDALIKMTKGDLPTTMIDQEKQAILTEIKQQILQRGLSYESYLKEQNKTEEQLLEGFDDQASDRIKLRLALQDISKKENIEVTDLDVEERLNAMLERYPEEQRAPIKQQYTPGSQAYAAIEYQITMQKTLEKIMPKV
jgi:trigger factor